jgi:hypothetical protein
LAWSFSRTGTSGDMSIIINGIVEVYRTSTSTGNYAVSLGDVISVDISTSSCTSPAAYANASVTGIITDDDCSGSIVTLTSSTYTVQSGDLGNTLTLTCSSFCNSACI